MNDSRCCGKTDRKDEARGVHHMVEVFLDAEPHKRIWQFQAANESEPSANVTPESVKPNRRRAPFPK